MVNGSILKTSAILALVALVFAAQAVLPKGLFVPVLWAAAFLIGAQVADLRRALKANS